MLQIHLAGKFKELSSNSWVRVLPIFCHTHLWYCACRKLNSSFIRSQFSVTVNLKGCVGCGGPWNDIETKGKKFSIQWSKVYRRRLHSGGFSHVFCHGGVVIKSLGAFKWGYFVGKVFLLGIEEQRNEQQVSTGTLNIVEIIHWFCTGSFKFYQEVYSKMTVEVFANFEKFEYWILFIVNKCFFHEFKKNNFSIRHKRSFYMNIR